MNILLTSAGRRSYLINYFKEALNGEGKIHAGNSEYSVALIAADESVITPKIYNGKYVDFIIEYCKKHDIKLIIPLFDIDLPILAKKKNRFLQNGIVVLVSDYKVTQICNDKWKTYKFLLNNGFNAPITYRNKDKAIKGLLKGLIKFPLIIKPRWGMGSIGIVTVNNLDELEVLYEKQKKHVFKTYLSYESRIDKENCLIIQENIVADEYGLDIINDSEAQYVTTFVKKKLSMRSGETDSAVTIEEPLFKKLGEDISQALKHTSILDADCFLKDNKVIVLELNCRFGGGYPFSHMAGANIPLAIISWVKGQKPDKNVFTIKPGIKGIKEINPIIVNER